jgi:hypothetical protein
LLCIFCLEERAGTKEHVFQETIGGTLVVERICKPCGDWLGTNVDAPLVDHLAVLVPRFQLGLKAKGRNLLDMFRTVLGTGTLADGTGRQIQMTIDPETGKPSPRLIYSTKQVTLDDGRVVEKISVDARDKERIVTKLKRTRRRDGLAPLSDVELRAEVDRIIAENESVIENPDVLYQLSVDTIEYQRGILKIAYELAWRWLGDDYLEDPSAERLRRAILKGFAEKDCEGVRRMIKFGADVDPFPLWAATPNSHIGFAMRAGEGIAVGIRVFSAVSGLILATETASRYPGFASGGTKGLFISIDPATGETRQTDLQAEFMRLSRSIHPPGGKTMPAEQGPRFSETATPPHL